MSHHFEIEIRIKYQRDYETASELTTSTEGDAPHGQVTASIAAALGAGVSRALGKINEDLGEPGPREILRQLLTQHAAHGNSQAASLLDELNKAEGGARAGTEAPARETTGDAPSIAELNAMFNAAGYGVTPDEETPQG